MMSNTLPQIYFTWSNNVAAVVAKGSHPAIWLSDVTICWSKQLFHSSLITATYDLTAQQLTLSSICSLSCSTSAHHEVISFWVFWVTVTTIIPEDGASGNMEWKSVHHINRNHTSDSNTAFHQQEKKHLHLNHTTCVLRNLLFFWHSC